MYRVGIIGLGKIAASYGKPEQAAPYCHVGGIRHSRRVTLAAVADMSEPATAAFKETWESSLDAPPAYYTDSQAMLAKEQLDIVAVCVRGPHHLNVMKQVLAAKPRAVFLEKPPTCSLAEMDELIALGKAAGVPITVSYSRHWTPKVMRMAQLVREGLIGKVTKVISHCGGTFLSFGSHNTDLMCQVIGYDPVAVYAVGNVPSVDVPAGYEPEPTIDTMMVEYASGVTGVQIDDGGMWAEVLGTEGRARLGMYIDPIAFNKDGQPIDVLSLMPENRSVFEVAYDEIAEHLDGGPKPACTDEAWHIVHEIGFAGIESVHTKARVTLPNTQRGRRVFANG